MSRQLVCPHCAQVIWVMVHSTLDVQAVGPTHDPLEALTAEERALIDGAKQTGLFEAFAKTVATVKGASAPRRMELYLLNVLRKAVRRRIPPYAMEVFNEQFGRAPLEYWATEGIGMVVIGGKVRLFVPNETLRGSAVRSLNPKSGVQRRSPLAIDDGKDKLEAWLRTRWGYVAPSQGQEHLLKTLRGRSFGEFARPGM